MATPLVSGEVARGSLEDEVNRALGVQAANGGAASGQHDGAPTGPQRGRQASAVERRAASQPEGDGESPRPTHAARQAAATARAATATLPAPRDHDEDPLTGPLPEQRSDGTRYTRSDVSKHPTEAAMHAA